MATDARPITPQLVIGIFLTLLGLVLTIDALRPGSSDFVFTFWPLALLAVGIAMLAQRSDSRGRFWGVFWTGLGGWLLLHSLGLITVGVGELIGPVILIIIGASVMRHTFCKSTAPAAPAVPRNESGLGYHVPPTEVPPIPNFVGNATNSPTGRVTLFTLMGEAKRASNDNPFRGGEMTAILGGCVLDLRQAVIAPGEEVVLDMLAVMAGHEIWVPPNWSVASDVVPMLGGVDDKRLPPLEIPATPQPRLRLRGFVLMGGIVIKN
jgi:predicted membrane protein